MLSIGLTGGIGCGKTTVSAMFANLGITIIDADVIAHKLTAATSPMCTKILNHFGKDYAKNDGSLERKKLRKLIFSNKEARNWLNSTLHPAIRVEIINALKQHHNESYVILSIPLLIESDKKDYIDRILVIDLPEELQTERASKRDDLNPNAIKKIIASQAPRNERLELADDIIDNSGSTAQLQRQVEELHQTYRKIRHI